MRLPVKLETMKEIEGFTNAIKQVDCDVRLVGKDENGKDWSLSAKSLLCSILIVAKQQEYRKHTAHEVDWNTIYCECEEDIYDIIKDYVE